MSQNENCSPSPHFFSCIPPPTYFLNLRLLYHPIIFFFRGENLTIHGFTITAIKLTSKNYKNNKPIPAKKLNKFFSLPFYLWPSNWKDRVNQTLARGIQFNRSISISEEITQEGFLALSTFAGNFGFYPVLVTSERFAAPQIALAQTCTKVQPRLFFTVWKMSTGKYPQTFPPETSLNIVQDYLRKMCEPFLNRFFTSNLSDHISERIMTFLDFRIDTSTSPDLFTMLFFKCVKIRRTSLVVQEILECSPHELAHIQLKSLKGGTWHFQFFGNHDSYYWWNAETRKSPLRSQPFSAHLSSLFDALTNSGMPTKLSDCLLAAYLDKRQKLSPHRDLFGKRYFDQHEHVFLTFAGLARDLVFNPHKFQRYDTRKFLFAIQCSPEISIELMPLANVLFVHSKTPSDQDGASLTFTFRRGVPYVQLRQFYPSIYHNARRQRR